MKKIKFLILLLIPLLLSGCLNNDRMDDIDIYTTSYPIEYVTNRLYGEHSNIKSIYPDGIYNGYKVSDKLLKDYSEGDLFIFNGIMEYYELDSEGNPILNNNVPSIASEKNYVTEMINNNHNLKIIDVSSSLDFDEDVNELWLDPIKLLTIANNIKKGFNEYINSTYLVKEINNNYQTLKEELLKLDADYREAANRGTFNTIVVSNDLFKYLTKYNINIISIEENENLTQKNIHNVEELIENGSIKYIYVLKGETPSETINNLIADTDIQLLELNNLNNISEEDRRNGKDYFTIMYDNLDKLKEELYK